MSKASRHRRTATGGTGSRPSRPPEPGQAFFRPPASASQDEPDGWGQSVPPTGPGARRLPTDREVVDLFLEMQRVTALGFGRGHPVEAALMDLVHRSAGRVRVTTVVTRILQGQVDRGWRSGWQPADLYHVARRHLGELPVLVLRDIVAKDLAAYAAATVAPRWHAQLAVIEAQVWWERDLDPLRARVENREEKVDEVLFAAAALAGFLATLPPLAVLDPLPGQARPARASPPDDVDVRLLSRVRQLLAQAESTPFEPEAETFSARAQTLMARHSLDAAMVSAATAPDERARPTAGRIHLIRPYEGPKTVLLNAVAGANRCRTVWSKDLGFVTVIGQPPDLVAVESLFTSLLVQADRAMIAEGRRTTSWGQSRTRSFRQSFLVAYATRIGERLRQAADDELAKHTGADQPGADAAAGRPGSTGPVVPGQDLVEVLHERSAEVDAATGELFPDLVQQVVRHSSDLDGWGAGSRAADRAALFDATAVETG